MNETKKRPTPQISPSSDAPFAPSRGSKLLNALDAALSELHGRRMFHEEIAAFTGQCTSTIFDWVNGANLRQVESFLRLFERLPRSKRAEILDRICRQMPTIYDDAIGWSAWSVSICEEVLRQKQGFTALCGDQNARDAVFTALAHTVSRTAPCVPAICGLDSRLANHFVPADGINYLGASLSVSTLHDLAMAAWPAIVKSKASYIMLNGVWAALPELHNDILKIGKSRHVIVADNLAVNDAQLTERFPKPARVLTVKGERDRRISLNFQVVR